MSTRINVNSINANSYRVNLDFFNFRIYYEPLVIKIDKKYFHQDEKDNIELEHKVLLERDCS